MEEARKTQEASLVDSLQQRLTDLEHKVQAYRHDLVTEFLHYQQHMLRDVSPTIASNVRQALAQSLSAYPLLSPALDLTDSRGSLNPGSSNGLPPPLPAIAPEPAGSGLVEVPGSPHDREKEFQGLFTPRYLPLLESSSETPKITPPSAHSPPIAPQGHDLLGQSLPPDTDIAVPNQQSEMVARVEPEGSRRSSATSQSPPRPGHVRQSTDDTTSSIFSDRSDSKAPRSALRRSSSVSKPPQSPRRVRFEFMGNEVLPTASPQPSEFIAPRPSSFTESTEENTNAGLILGDDEEEADSPPRKVSSSEALRALSREPLDQGTVWTVVNYHPDDIVIEQNDGASTKPVPALADSQSTMAAPEPSARIVISERVRRQQLLGDLEEQDANDDVDGDDSSEDEFLSMAKPKSFNNKKTIQSTKSPLATIPSSDQDLPIPPRSPSSMKTGQDTRKSDEDADPASPEDAGDDGDDMFDFETGGLSAPPRPRSKHLPDDEEEEPEPSPTDTSSIHQQLYATSPAVPISRPPVAPTSPTIPRPSRFQPGTVGSYKGRPVVMPVVRNPEVHAQAASLGQFNTFVGGLDGRSGMDEGDLNSFRASFANTAFSGTPRSLTERMMMEDANPSKRRGTEKSK